MSITKNYTFSTTSDYTYDSATTSILSSTAFLALLTTTGNIYSRDFNTSTGFTYDVNKTIFTSGSMTQKDQRPTNSTIYFSFTNNEDADWATGSQNGVISGAATITAGKLRLVGASQFYFSGAGNINNWGLAGKTGTIRFKYIPNFSGLPANYQYISEHEGGGNKGAIFISHRTTGDFSIDLFDESGVQHAFYSSVVTVTAGTEYVLELDVNFGGNSYFFVNGVTKGVFNTTSYNRTNSWVSTVYFNRGLSLNANFSLDDYIAFNTCQHLADHTSEIPYTYPLTIYAQDDVILPNFTYPGGGNLLKYSTFSVTSAGNFKYQVNNQYYNSTTGWTSATTITQANIASEINANITLLNAANTTTVHCISESTNTVSSIANLKMAYIGQEYYKTNPTIYPTTALNAESITSITINHTATGSDLIKGVMMINDVDYYYTGSSWATSTGYAQSNLVADIQANISTLPLSGGKETKFKLYLHSDAGITTPYIYSITIVYDYKSPIPIAPSLCLVYGYIYDNIGTPIQGVDITAKLIKTAAYKSSIAIETNQLSTTSRADGYWELNVVETANMAANSKYRFVFSGTNIKRSVEVSIPNQDTVNFETL